MYPGIMDASEVIYIDRKWNASISPNPQAMHKILESYTTIGNFQEQLNFIKPGMGNHILK